MLGILLITSCSSGTPDPDNALQHGAAKEDLSARLVLRVLKDQGQVKKVGVIVLNPAGAPIQSIRSWVRFDSAALQVKDLAIEDGRFSLFAPGEREIDLAEGFVKLGGAVRKPLHDKEILFASFTIRSPSKEAPVLSFYDWKAEGDGHTAVLSLHEKSIVNILHAPPSIEL